MRLLLFGGWGQLGSDLEHVCGGRHELIRPTRREVDVTDPDMVLEAARASRPQAVIDAAAFHKVEACEQDPQQALAVNATGALNVGRAAQAVGARCVVVSTDYVFGADDRPGYREDDPVAPVNVYGVSKAAGGQPGPAASQICPAGHEERRPRPPRQSALGRGSALVPAGQIGLRPAGCPSGAPKGSALGHRPR